MASRLSPTPARVGALRAARPWRLALAGLLAAPGAMASSLVAGQVSNFTSPQGLTERCVVLTRMPGASYSERDQAEEAAFCRIDFNAGSHALCPKLFSTSPGTLVYDLASGPYAARAAAFEAEVCTRTHGIARDAADEPLSFKMSVNTRETSATFANSALVYYHYARYFDAAVHVPPAVLRTMDRRAHLERVARRGEAASAGVPALKLNHAAWSVLVRAEGQPDSYTPADELFSADRGQVYGVLLHPRGRRYGEEVNGSRQSGWGDGQSRDFQQTPPFVALATDRPLAESIDEGLARGHLHTAVPAAVRREQMAFWMRELVDITLLDFLFSQQDRIGNIDYLSYWYWVADGQVRRMPAQGAHPPDEIARHAPKLLKRTELADNDAGVRTSYINYTQRTGMLERVRHMSPVSYRQLMALDRDFAARGPLYEHTRTGFGLSAPELAQIVSNTAKAARILRESCHAGRLRFDLDPEAYLRDGRVAETKLDCNAP
ncbi:MAG: hypothetical protein RI936_1202 [Pseudomonadota bacterium]